MHTRRTIAWLSLWTAILTPAALAGDLFELDAAATDASGITASVTSSDLLELVDHALNTQGNFAALSGRPFDADLSYAGVQNAIELDSNAAGTSVTLRFPITGFSQTFTGPTRADVENQIEEFIRDNGSDEYARFLEAINELAAVSLVDGNPQAITAELAQLAFYRHGTPYVRGKGIADSNAEFWLQIAPRGDFFEAEGFEGTEYGLNLHTGARFTDRVALSLSGFVTYTQIEEADVFRGGLSLGLPIQVFGPRDGIVGVQLTPLAQIGGTGSDDTASGGLVYGYGANLAETFRIGDFEIILAHQLIQYDGGDFEYDGFEFSTHVDQLLMTHGVMLLYTTKAGLFLDAGVDYNRFLKDAAVEDWYSPNAGLGWDAGIARVRVGYRGQFGDHFESHAALVSLSFGR